ncbi:MAG: 3-phosphoshikimate 1-carboxyvinyltransferase [Xanthomonadales bacterium]|nr:3-phosphoshikimate 1-carboxyvinyltransferase [Xanthomonadales bacterium]
MQTRLKVAPADEGLTGTLRPPGDKSISHRALILGALASGETRISGLLESEDVLATLRAVEQLGARVIRDGNDVLVHGTGGRLSAAGTDLDMGNSGTAMRLLAGVLCAQEFESRLLGDASLSRRPMRRIMNPLRQMGASIEGSSNDTAPLRIRGARLRGIEYDSPVASAQVKSCLLLAGLFAEGRTRVSEPTRSRDHTERMLRQFQAQIDDDGTVNGGGGLQGTHVQVPGDISSAAFPLFAALLVPGSDIMLEGVGINPTRDGMLKAVRAMGAEMVISDARKWGLEPVANIRVCYSGRLRAIDLDPQWVPSMIDELPGFMVLAACATGVTRIRGASELRVKESDRLEVMAKALRRLGVDITLYEDGADIVGAGRFESGLVDGAGDHRCAMSLAVLGLVTDKGLAVDGAGMISTSYPGFTADMNHLGAAIAIDTQGASEPMDTAVPVVAIDGPVGSGKGTISTGLARRLGWHFLDSGALYRLVALAAMNEGVNASDEAAVARVAQELDFGFREANGESIPLLDGEDVSLRIRSEDVSAMASRVATVPAVRQAMVGRQRAFARAPGLVADGRDMGTVIFPDAPLKIFLTASAQARAERRYKQLKEKGESVNLSRLFRDIEARDARDTTRAVAPLKPADDAIVIDSTEYSINEVLDKIESLLHEMNLID